MYKCDVLEVMTHLVKAPTTNCSPLKMVVSKSGISFCTGLYFINGRTAGFRKGNRCIAQIRMAKKELERSIKIARDSYDTHCMTYLLFMVSWNNKI